MSPVESLAARIEVPAWLRSNDRKRLVERLAALRPAIEARPQAPRAAGRQARSGPLGVPLRQFDRLLGINRAHASDEPMSLLAPLLAQSAATMAVYFALAGLLVLSQGLALAIAVLIGLQTGRGLVTQRRDAIHRRMEEQFALGLGVIIRGVRAGLPVAEGMRAVAGEVAAPTGPEFRRAVDQVQLGDSFEGALAGLATRCALPEYRFFAVTVVLQRQTGGNLAETLDNLHQTMRMRRGIRLKAQALTSETRATVLVLALLPVAVTLVLLVVSPVYILQLFVTPSGRFLLGVAMVVQAFGLVVIRIISRRALA